MGEVYPAVAVDNPTERPTPVQASEELTRQVEEARALVAILQAALEEVEDNPEIIHWGHVGTMAEVLSALREAVKQINALA